MWHNRSEIVDLRGLLWYTVRQYSVAEMSVEQRGEHEHCTDVPGAGEHGRGSLPGG